MDTLAPGNGAYLHNPGSPLAVTFSGESPSSSAFPSLVGKLGLVSLPYPGRHSCPLEGEIGSTGRSQARAFSRAVSTMIWTSSGFRVCHRQKFKPARFSTNVAPQRAGAVSAACSTSTTMCLPRESTLW